MSDRIYPDTAASPFPGPPRTITDADGREISLRAANEDDVAAVVTMYHDFDPDDRAQGIPPVGDDAIQEWVETLLTPGRHNAIAVHGDRVVGHATLVPDVRGDGVKAEREDTHADADPDSHELAIFVLGRYQGAGIGTALLETTLGLGQQRGVERVWLTVERWNQAAISLYRTVGFETSGADSFELEMSIKL
jgi:GNAT superfamily N-acetyltransferase